MSEPIDLDLHSPEFLERRMEVYAELRERCPVVFDTAHGGFWLITDYENVLTVAVPAVLTLQMMGLPSENWSRYAEFFHAIAAYPSASPEFAAGMAHAPEMLGELLGHAA